MDLIAETLEHLRQPAALYDVEGHFVAANRPAWDWFTNEVPNEYDTREAFRHHMGLEAVLRIESTTGYLTPYGWLYASPMSNVNCLLSRPDLVLLTLHPGCDEAVAKLDHDRTLIMLRLNENAERTIRALQAVVLQAQASLDLQRNLVEELHLHAQEIFHGDRDALRENDEKNNSGKS